VGFEFPDINASPRPITDAELAFCLRNGVTAITEMVVGLDGIVVVNSGTERRHSFSLAQVFSALAAEVEQGGRLVKNPYFRWREIDPALPDWEIQVMGPPVGSPAYDAFIELIMERGCARFPVINDLPRDQRFVVCRSVRRDAAFSRLARQETDILEWLRTHPKAFAITRFSILKEHSGRIRGNPIEGVAPTPENITDGLYPLTRPIYLYIKIRHLEAVKGLQYFLYECASERAIGPEGYLVDKGFIPLDDIGRNRARDKALSLAPMSR
jgi:phosphate transport system substrate-binding protein